MFDTSVMTKNTRSRLRASKKGAHSLLNWGESNK
jgi:hypothetical protein